VRGDEGDVRVKQPLWRAATLQERDTYRPSRQYRAGRVPIWDDAHAYRIEAGEVGAVLMHATFGSPWEMRSLAEFLAANGITVICPLFQGHGTTPEAFASANPRKWIDDARRALQWLQERTSTQFLIGQCLGGRVAMALHVEDRLKVAGIVTISTPFTPPPRTPFLPSPFDRWPIDLTPRSLPLFHRLNLVPDNMKRISLHSLTPWRCYQQYRPASSWEIVNRLRKKLSTQLDRVNAPCLIVHAAHDHLHPASNAHFAYQQISSTDKELYLIDAVTHIVSTNIRTKQIVFKKILRFIQQHAATHVSERH
jgi:carboxylesterase